METATWKWDESFLPARWVVATYDSTLGIYTVKPAAPPQNNQIEPWVDSSQKHFAVWVLFESERDGMLLNHLYLYIWICKYCSLNKHGQTKTMLSSDIKGCLKTNIHGIHHHLRRITTFDKCLLSRGKKKQIESQWRDVPFVIITHPIEPWAHSLRHINRNKWKSHHQEDGTHGSWEAVEQCWVHDEGNMVSVN